MQIFRERYGDSSRGFTLIEVLLACAILAVVATGVAHLIALSITAGRAAREQTFTAILASSKLEQLRSLTWSYQPGLSDPPVRRSDNTTNLSVEPASAGGPGLSASPPRTLDASVPPYVDYLDGLGRWVGNGPSPPATAAFVRRWSVQPLPADPPRTVILSVLVTTVARDRARAGRWIARSGSDTLLVTLNTRKGK